MEFFFLIFCLSKFVFFSIFFNWFSLLFSLFLNMSNTWEKVHVFVCTCGLCARKNRGTISVLFWCVFEKKYDFEHFLLFWRDQLHTQLLVKFFPFKYRKSECLSMFIRIFNWHLAHIKHVHTKPQKREIVNKKRSIFYGIITKYVGFVCVSQSKLVTLTFNSFSSHGKILIRFHL